MTYEALRARRGEILEIVKRHGGRNEVFVFGSVARGQDRPESDVDLLLELENGRSLLDRAAIQRELSERLGVKVESASPHALHRLLRESILREAKPL